MTIYSFEFCGNCLGDLVPNGTTLTADPSLPVQPMDIVSVLLRRCHDGPFASFINTMGAGGFMGVCKVFLGCKESPEGELLYLVGQLNPPTVSPIPAHLIEALHRVVDGEIPADAPERVSEDDAAALRLLIPFVGVEVEPVNPAWQEAA